MKKVSILLIVMLVLFSMLPSPMLAAAQTGNISDADSENVDKTVENDDEKELSPAQKEEAASEKETDSAQKDIDKDSSKDKQEKADTNANEDVNQEDISNDSNEEFDAEGNVDNETSTDEVEQDTSTAPDQTKGSSENSDSVEVEASEDAEKDPVDQEKSEIDEDSSPEITEEESEEESTSKLGHLRSHAVIYESLGDENSTKDTSGYFNAVYYIKQQANFEGDLYYKISKEPSSTKGVVGWVKSTQVSTHSHVGVDKAAKTFYIKGSGKAFTKAWGGSKDIVYDLSSYEDAVFKVNLTEKVGKNTWYRGMLDGKVVWAHSSYVKTDKPVDTVKKSNTSRLGHLKSNAVLYGTPGDESSTKDISGYFNAVYYIKQQAMVDDNLYYKISNKPSRTEGVVGWVKAAHLSTHSHVGVNKDAKTYFIKGTGQAFTKAWGGSKDLVYNLSEYENQAFKVHLTEKVGNNIWYRGVLDGQVVWAHSSYVMENNPVEGSSTSKLGHLRGNAVLYEIPGNENSAHDASQYGDAVYYIKEQANIDGQLYYKISQEPSSTKGVIGWVKASQMSTHSHKGVDKYPKQFYLTGEGNAYGKAWGGSKDLVYDLDDYRNEPFRVHLTEKVGNNIWYRGTLDGKTVWVHYSYVMPIQPTDTSKLGHIRSGNAKIYPSLSKLKTYKLAGDKYTNAVHYIKSEANVNGETFYLISNDPSDKTGVVGWVKAKDLSTHSHKGTNLKREDVFFTGDGKTFTKAWGGSKDTVYSNMSKYEGQRLKVDLIEKVGNNVWYRGIFNGKTVWIHESFVTKGKMTNKSLIGHLKSGAKIYERLGDQSTLLDSAPYLNTVYFIKKQAVINGQTYNLISTVRSGTKGVIGWVDKDMMKIHEHSFVTDDIQEFFFTGEGKAYDAPWGGAENVVYGDLSKDVNESFEVNATENVGDNIWYGGTYKGKRIWIHESYVVGNITTYTKYDMTLQEALNMQMKAGPQTDKYSKEPAYIHASLVDFTSTAAVNYNGVRLRTSTSLKNNDNVAAKVNKGTPVTVKDTVKGDNYQGSTKWYKIKYKKQTLYVHASLVNTDDEVAVTNGKVNIRAGASTSSHIYDTVSKGTSLNIIEKGEVWHKITYNNWRNSTAAETKFHMDPNNFADDPIKKYQFLDLKHFTGVPVSELRPFLAGKGILDGTENMFRNAARSVGINELYLISHAILETGNGTSKLAKGVKHNGKTVYNFFGIGAYDNCPVDCGAERAYKEGWFTPEDAIMGGAKFAGNNYINVGQSTLYTMRWNPKFMELNKKAGHQYATDIGWAGKQIGYYNDFYSQGRYNLKFNIPVYN